MLYQLYDLNRLAMMPLRYAAAATQEILSNPVLPFAHTHTGRSWAAAFELFERSTRHYQKPEFGLDRTLIDGEEVPVAEAVEAETPFCRLVRFERWTEREDPKVLIVAPLSGHFATLLRGTVEAMLPAHDVYITDWSDAAQVPMVDGEFDLDDYLDHIVDFLHHIGPGAHVMAVCQPSVPVLGAVSLMSAAGDPCVPRSMTLMGGPIDTRINKTVVNDFAERHSIEWFEQSVVSRVPLRFPGAMRRVYPGFLQLTGFMVMNIERHVGAHMKLFEHLVVGDGDSADAHRRFYDEYMSVMDLPAEFYLQTVETVFQKHDLPQGRWVSRNRPIDPGAIEKTALLTVEGELDDISAVGQTAAAHELCRNLPDKLQHYHLQKKVGHYGIFNGRRWREQIQPVVHDFIRAHA